jgi:hypothetical protein
VPPEKFQNPGVPSLRAIKVGLWDVPRTALFNKPFYVQGCLLVQFKDAVSGEDKTCYASVSGCLRAADDLVVLRKALEAAGCTSTGDFSFSLPAL